MDIQTAEEKGFRSPFSLSSKSFKKGKLVLAGLCLDASFGVVFAGRRSRESSRYHGKRPSNFK
jgi:hypothetical protein